MQKTQQNFLIGTVVAAVLSWVGWWMVLTRLHPFREVGAEESIMPMVNLVLFYLTFFFAMSSLFVLLGYVIRLVTYRHELYFVHLNLALRQGVLLGGLAVFLLIFQAYRVLTWWDSVLMVVVVVLLEFYFISRSRSW